MIRLSDCAQGRDNNLNLIRMAAATGVLVSHAWPLSSGPDAVQPLVTLTEHSLGTLCVYIFFVISGFLIAQSFERSSTKTRFVNARVLRLVPGLFVSVAVVALLMGPIVTTLTVGDYFTDRSTWMSILRNTAMAWPEYELPGVFMDNPHPTVQGSIWTLFHEALCYVGVFIVGVLGLFARRALLTPLLFAWIALAFVIAWRDISVIHPRVEEFFPLSIPFVVGTLLYVWREKVQLTVFAVPVFIGLAALLKGTPAYELAFVWAVAYATFWAGYVPKGSIRSYNQLGDYSYGMYIYAFPIQGLVVWLFGAMGPYENMAWSIPLTLVLSILSWHLIERPALSLRDRKKRL